MTSKLDIAVTAALVSSLAVNLVVLNRRWSSHHRAPAAIRSAAIDPARPMSLLPSDIDSSSPCDQQLAEVQRRLDAARADLDARQTPKERFDKGTPDPASEAEVKPAVAAMFADAPADFHYELECRSRICLVTAHVGSADYDWVEAIQNPAYRDRWSSRSFHRNQAYLALRDPP